MASELVDIMGQSRDDIFRTKFFVKDKVCSVIINGKHLANLVSTNLVGKLRLPLLNHPKPYVLRSLPDSDEVKVEYQVMVAFTTGRFHDEMMCDVVPMSDCHILLGGSWKYDKQVWHHVERNMYVYITDEWSVMINLLTPHKAYEDQLIMK